MKAVPAHPPTQFWSAPSLQGFSPCLEPTFPGRPWEPTFPGRPWSTSLNQDVPGRVWGSKKTYAGFPWAHNWHQQQVSHSIVQMMQPHSSMFYMIVAATDWWVRIYIREPLFKRLYSNFGHSLFAPAVGLGFLWTACQFWRVWKMLTNLDNKWDFQWHSETISKK